MLGKPNIQELVYHWAYGDLTESRVEHEEGLEGLQPHENLRGLILAGFGGLRFASWMRTRDARSLQNLVRIKLKDCRLCEKVPSLGHLPYLEIVELDGLHNLSRIGSEFYGSGAGIDANTTSSGAAGAVFPALRELFLRNMMNLEEWSEISSLPTGVKSIKEFFPRLEYLSISECPRLITIPGNSLSIERIKISSITIPLDWNIESEDRLMYRPCLYILVADQDSEHIIILVEDLLEKSSKSLRSLEIWGGFNKLRYFPTQLLNLKSLEKLVIQGCNNLRSFCEDTKAVVFNCLKSFKQLHILSCLQLIMTDSDGLRSLMSLQDLAILSCPGLAGSWVEGLFCLSSLRKVVIGRFSGIDHFPWPSTSVDAANVNGVQQCPFISLESLSLWCGGKANHHLPDQLQHLTALTNLEIRGFLELKSLPEWLGNLSSLQSLTLELCPKLFSLPSLEAIQRLTNLRNLKVDSCPRLQERFKSGEEGRKIAHIPSVKIGRSRFLEYLLLVDPPATLRAFEKLGY